MAPLLHFLRPTNYVVARIILEKSLDLYLIVEKQIVSLQRKSGKKISDVFVCVSEERLKRLLRICPWWRAGHLELGFLELDLGAKYSDKNQAARAVATAKLSAEAVRKLLGPAHLITRGRKFKILLKARVLEGFVLSRYQKYEESLLVLKSVLALNNSSLIATDLLCQTLEAAANAAYIVGNGQLALEYFNRVPLSLRSREGILLMDTLTTQLTD